jgi:DNA (cytosine-5)-methyltransferase 1
VTAYYNENDPYVAQWLRNLVSAGHIAPGDVDDRSITDVRPGDLEFYDQCHFFAGIGVWSLALRMAGVPDERRIWTGSCPCQPFSQASNGKQKGFADERHLWPVWFGLIRECRPVSVLGEQVASKDGLMWLDAVHADLEGAGYACGAVDTCAAGVGAPHIRQRLWFVAVEHAARDGRIERRSEPGERRVIGGRSKGVMADADDARLEGRREPERQRAAERPAGPRVVADGMADAAGEQRGARRFGAAGSQPGEVVGPARPCPDGGMADAEQRRVRSEGYGAAGRATSGMQGADGQRQRVRPDNRPGDGTVAVGMADADDAGCKRLSGNNSRRGTGSGPEKLEQQLESDSACSRSGPLHGFWRDADWLFCRDGKWRPVESGAQPLAHGVASRVGRLRACGNAIVAPQAEVFIRACGPLLNIEIGREATDNPDSHRVAMEGP